MKNIPHHPHAAAPAGSVAPASPLQTIFELLAALDRTERFEIGDVLRGAHSPNGPLLPPDTSDTGSEDGLLYDRGGGNGKGTGPSKNFDPSARDDSVQGLASDRLQINVLDNDWDRNGDTLRVTAINGSLGAVGAPVLLASGAIVTLQEDGTLTYAPESLGASLGPGEAQTDQITYTVSDGVGGVATATVSITVTGTEIVAEVTELPVAHDDTYETTQGELLSGNLLENDFDPSGLGLKVVSVNGDAGAVSGSLGLASGGILTVNSDGTFTYTPAVYDGSANGARVLDQFTYLIEDANGQYDEAIASITVDGLVQTGATPDEDPAAPVDAPPYYVEDLLISEASRWNAGEAYGTSVQITYTFLQDVPDYYGVTHWAKDGFAAFSEAQMEATRAALDHISAFAGVEFVEVSDASQAGITFGFAALPFGVGATYTPSADGVDSSSGDVWLTAKFAGSGFVAGSGEYKTLIHEIGHALGLDHPETLSGEEATRKFTMMSYLQNPDAYPLGEAQTPMLFDVATLQHLYGANLTDTAGDDTYTAEDLYGRIMTLWDAGGSDTIDLSSVDTNLKIDLREGEFSTAGPAGENNLALAYGTTIENAFAGTGDDILIGNDADNLFSGGEGADTYVLGSGFGFDRITDFETGIDKLDLAATGAGWSDLEIWQTLTGTMIALGDDRIELEGVDAIEEEDLLFGFL